MKFYGPNGKVLKSDKKVEPSSDETTSPPVEDRDRDGTFILCEKHVEITSPTYVCKNHGKITSVMNIDFEKENIHNVFCVLCLNEKLIEAGLQVELFTENK